MLLRTVATRELVVPRSMPTASRCWCGAVSVPLLAYSAGAFLGRSVNLLLRQRSLRFTTIYETAMADSLKSMAPVS